MPASGLELRLLSTNALTPALLYELRDILDAAFEDDFSHADRAHALGGTHALLLDEETGALLAHACVVPRRL